MFIPLPPLEYVKPMIWKAKPYVSPKPHVNQNPRPKDLEKDRDLFWIARAGLKAPSLGLDVVPSIGFT